MNDLQTAMEDAIARIWDAIQSAELSDIPAIAEYLIAQSETIRKKGEVSMNKNRPRHHKGQDAIQSIVERPPLSDLQMTATTAADRHIQTQDNADWQAYCDILDKLEEQKEIETMNKNQTALEELIQDYGQKLAQQALWSAQRVTLISLAALAHCQSPTTEEEQEELNEKATELAEEDGAAIPLADVQYSLDEATRYLAEMERQHKLGIWLAYLFESLEESIGVVALHYARAVLRARFNNSRW